MKELASRVSFFELSLFLLLLVSFIFLYKFDLANSALSMKTEELRKLLDAERVANIGDAVPPITANSLTGHKVELTFNNHPKTLIFLYSTSCQFCQSDFPVWEQLISNSLPKSLPVAALSLSSQEDTESGISETFTRLRSITIIAPDSVLRTYRAYATPQILIISSSGVVEWSHVGRLNAKVTTEIQQTLATNQN